MPKAIEVKNKISKELRDFIEQWKGKKGTLIMVLHKVQQTYGYVPRDIAFQLTELMDVPLAKIYGVITFYHFFKLKKPGKNQIAVCMGTACYLKGGEDLIKDLEEQLGIGLNATTPDKLFSLEAVRCLGCCGLAPVMTINGEVYANVGRDQLKKILKKYQEPAHG